MEQGVFAEMATAEEVGRRFSLGLVDGWMFKGLSVYFSGPYMAQIFKISGCLRVCLSVYFSILLLSYFVWSGA